MTYQLYNLDMEARQATLANVAPQIAQLASESEETELDLETGFGNWTIAIKPE